MPIDAHSAVIRAGQRVRDLKVFDASPSFGFKSSVVERDKQCLRREEQCRGSGIAGSARTRSRTATSTSLARNHRIVVE